MFNDHISGWALDCGNSSALAMELLQSCAKSQLLTHWGRATHTCVGKLTIIGSDNGLSPGRRQAIIWTSAGILLIGPLGTNFNEILIGIQTVSFKKIHLKMLSGKRRPFCLGLNVLTLYMLNYFEETEKYIFVLCHFWSQRWLRLLKAFLLDDKDLFSLQSQHHGC